jgi:anti-anti-sigma factor
MTTILAIEDEANILANLQDILELEGFDVLTAANGKVGVELARRHRPDLIICDVSMPELNGYDVLVALRQDAKTIEIPFVFLTANASRADFRKGMSLGADDYLTKPFTPSELREAIGARLEKQAMLMERYKQSLERNFQAHTNAANDGKLAAIQTGDSVNTVRVVRPTGVLDVTTCERLRREIMGVIDTGCRNVVVDCQDLTFMDSSGLAALVLASQKVREANSKLAICSINQQIEMLFTLSSMDDIFEIYPSIAEFSAN